MPDAAAPTILILSLQNWGNAARWPRWLGEAGWRVAVLAPPGEVVFHAQGIAHRQLLPVEALAQRDALLAVLAHLIPALGPDLVLPADESAVTACDQLALTLRSRRDPVSIRTVALLRRSRGDPTQVTVLQDKHATLDLARRLGIAVPAQVPVTTREEVVAFARTHSWPVVLKRPSGFAGKGVAICTDPGQVDQALAGLGGLGPVAVQRHISGTPGFCNVAAWQGRIRASLEFRKVTQVAGPTSPAAIVRHQPDASMRSAAERLVAATGLSGIVSFDFQCDAAGIPWLLECNPRPVPASHLGHRLGNDLFLAMRCGLEGRLYQGAAGPSQDIALFPKELLRDPGGSRLATCFHDVPWEEPDLVRILSGS